MIDPMARIVGAYSAGIILCLVYIIGILSGVPIYNATIRAMTSAFVAYFVGRTASVLFLRTIARTIAESVKPQGPADETSQDDQPVSR